MRHRVASLTNRFAVVALLDDVQIEMRRDRVTTKSDAAAIEQELRGADWLLCGPEWMLGAGTKAAIADRSGLLRRATFLAQDE